MPRFRRTKVHGQAPLLQRRVQTSGRTGISRLHGLAKRNDIYRNLIRVWIRKYEAGESDEDAAAADLLQLWLREIQSWRAAANREICASQYSHSLPTRNASTLHQRSGRSVATATSAPTSRTACARWRAQDWPIAALPVIEGHRVLLKISQPNQAEVARNYRSR